MVHQIWECSEPLLLSFKYRFFYLYIISVCYSDFKLKPKYLLHLLPFLIANLALLPRFYGIDTASKISFIQNRQSMVEFRFNHILIHLQIIVYIIAVFIVLRKSKKLYVENNAGINPITA